jgi:hypothetical protein
MTHENQGAERVRNATIPQPGQIMLDSAATKLSINKGPAELADLEGRREAAGGA